MLLWRYASYGAVDSLISMPPDSAAQFSNIKPLWLVNDFLGHGFYSIRWLGSGNKLCEPTLPRSRPQESYT